MNAHETEIARHKTAIWRPSYSLPIKCLLRDGLVHGETSVFDYGCGHGQDIELLRGSGIPCDGWDPAFQPDAPKRPADVVNLGYVINVIEDARERATAVRAAWDLCTKLLVVAAQIEFSAPDKEQRPFADGVLTSRGTFQKYYTQSELRAYLEAELATDAIPAAPGVFYLFKDEAAKQQFLATRFHRRISVPRKRISELRFEQNLDVLEPLMAALTKLGRLPGPEEFPQSAVVIERFGSLNKAFALIRRVTDAQPWEDIAQRRSEDLLVYLALSRLGRRPKISQLPAGIQRDVKAFLGNYAQACARADTLLFRAGDPTAIDAACQQAEVGKLVDNALIVHRTALDDLPPMLRIYEGCARAYLGEIDDANVVKLHRYSGKVSYLACPDFDAAPHPVVRRAIKLALRTLHMDCRNYRDEENPPILDRKDLLVGADYPSYDKFARLSQQETSYGIFADLTNLPRLGHLAQQLEDAGLALRGHRLVAKSDADRRRMHARRASLPKPEGKPKELAPDFDAAPEPKPAGSLAGTVPQVADANMSQPGQVASTSHRSRRRSAARPASILPERSRRFGVGKEIGHAVYVHRDYEDRLGPAVAEAKRRLPDGAVYHIVKYNVRTQAVSFICCPRLDADPEPAVHEVLIVRPDGHLRRRTAPADPEIYHHKWLFVAEDYQGFDVAESQRRSSAWLGLADIDKSRIGRKSYWVRHVTPRLDSASPDAQDARRSDHGAIDERS